MNTVRKFEDPEVWKMSICLIVEIHKNISRISSLILREQIFKSALSIPSNIAEGFERNSNKEFMRFHNISKGFCAELKTRPYVAAELQLIPKNFCNAF